MPPKYIALQRRPTLIFGPSALSQFHRNWLFWAWFRLFVTRSRSSLFGTVLESPSVLTFLFCLQSQAATTCSAATSAPEGTTLRQHRNAFISPSGIAMPVGLCFACDFLL